MPFVEFTALLALATAMSFSPGPNTTLSTALAANRGLPAAMRFVCAVPVGWTALLLLCAGGLGALLVAVPLLRLAVKALGIGYLLYLAFKLARSAQLSQADAARLNVGFWQGVGLQFLNIKAWLLALTLVAGWIAGRPTPAAPGLGHAGDAVLRLRQQPRLCRRRRPAAPVAGPGQPAALVQPRHGRRAGGHRRLDDPGLTGQAAPRQAPPKKARP